MNWGEDPENPRSEEMMIIGQADRESEGETEREREREAAEYHNRSVDRSITSEY